MPASMQGMEFSNGGKIIIVGSRVFGGISTLSSGVMTVDHLREGEHVAALVTGTDTAVGAGMLFGGPKAVAFGVGYFGSKLVVLAGEVINDAFESDEPLITENP